MQIGILTFHCAHNYGAVIQCYGLQEYLRSLGHQVYVVDYRPNFFDAYKLPNLSFVKSKSLWSYSRKLLKFILIGNTQKRRFKVFENFITNRLNLTPYIKDGDYSNFDALILGSDQIWNPNITGGAYDKEYFGANAVCKVISYAASSRSTSLSEEQKQYYQQHLSAIDYISVRESSLKTLLQPLVSKPITTVIDPSFLPDVAAYEQMCSNVKITRPYIFVYEIERHEGTLRIAREIARSLNAEIVEFVSQVTPSYCLKNSIKQDLGPQDFLSYIKNAACVVTTSFHGMALSLKFQKDFYSIRQGTNADLRAESLLTMIGLSDRFISMDDVVLFSKIDYAECLPKLQDEINKSKDFLLNALK